VIFFWLNERGVSQRELARLNDTSQSTIWRAIRRGEAAFTRWDPPRLELLLGRIGQSGLECEHERPIQIGEQKICLVCFCSGYDQVDAMQITAQEQRALSGEPERREPEKSFAERMHPEKKGRKHMLSQKTKDSLKADIHASGGTLTGLNWTAIIQAIEAILAALGPILNPASTTPPTTP